MNAIVLPKRSLSLRYLFFLLALFGMVSCQKEISEEHNQPPGGGITGGSAQFTLAPSGSNCSDAAVSGAFKAGTDLGLDAQLTVTVNVTKAGDWTYATAPVNGFVFAGAGNFTATGTQVITLQAVGKPAAAGNFDFPLNIGGATCKVTVTVGDASGGGGGINIDDFYYKATIDGVNYLQGVTETNGYEPGSSLAGVDEVYFGGSINYGSSPVPAGLTQFGIEKGIMKGYYTATPAQVKAFFAPGDYPYAPVSFNDGNGVHIGWSDPNGEDWDTRDGTKDQTGSTFKIISTEDLVDITGTYYVKVKVQFSCKLYNVKTGAVKQVTNGEAVIAFGMI